MKDENGKPILDENGKPKKVQGSGGIISIIASRLGVEWETAQSYIFGKDKDGNLIFPQVNRAYNEENERVIDVAESNIVAAVHARDIDVSFRYLAVKGKKRGYGQTGITIDPSGKNGDGQTVVQIYIPDNGRDKK